MRFMTAYLSATEGKEHTITGTDRMKHRPISILVDALRYLGADIEYIGEEGYPPLRIKGKKLTGGHLEVPGNISSQYISALLMIGPTLTNGLELQLTGDVISRPYIDLTLWTMKEFCADVDWADSNTILVKSTPYKSRPYLIENDWSASSYWYEILALCGSDDSEIKLEGLMDGSKQGDSLVKYIFCLLGIKTIFASTEDGKPTTVTIKKHRCMLPRLDYDFGSCPDLAQTFVVCCCEMGIQFKFTGLATLKIKETDRILALQNELFKYGAQLDYMENGTLSWNGKRRESCYQCVSIPTYQDHRMAMAFAPIGMCGDPVIIQNPEVVAKSYPAYWEGLKMAGFGVK